MDTSVNNKVLIIGAGLGGLAFAQVLRVKGVPFEIFERDETLYARRQGWAVALQESVGPFRGALGPGIAEDIYDTSVNHNTGAHDELAFVDATTACKVASVGNVAPGQPGFVLRVSRENFRSYLWNLNGLPVTSGKRYMRYESDDTGVTAYFDDGTTARGSLLVGADGAHSHVLDQLLGSVHQPTYSRWVAIVGEVALSPEQYKPYRDLGNAVVLSTSPKVRMQHGLLHMEPDQSSAAYFWATMIRHADPKECADWVCCHTTEKQELYDYVLTNTKEVHPLLTELIKIGGVQGIADRQLKLIEFVPPDTLPAGRVAVLGDAAHTMIPFRGAGANTAVLDACDLGLALAQAFHDKKDLASVVPEYNEKMIPRGQEMVISSHEAGEGGASEPGEYARRFRRDR